MGAPDDKVVEIFVGGSWVDITQYVDWSAGLTTQYGRSSPFSAAQSATMSLTLDNTDGRFSPLRQVLADGVTAHPYYPNLVPRVPIRFAWIMAGVRYYRFTGLVKGWPPVYKDEARPRVTIGATDRAAQLTGVTMQSPLLTQMIADAPTLYWPLNDSGDTGQAVEQFGGPSLLQVKQGNGGTISFGASGPGSANGSGVQFTAGSVTDATILQSTALSVTAGAISAELWFNAGTSFPSYALAGNVEWLINLVDNAGTVTFTAGIDNNGHILCGCGLVASATAINVTSKNVLDGKYHQLVMTVSAAGAIKVYLDGSLAGSGSTAPVSVTYNQIQLGDDAATPTTVYGPPYTGLIGQVAIYKSVLSAAEVSAHYTAATGYLGETVDARIARFLGLAGLTTGDYNLDASAVPLSSSPQAGQDPFTASQGLADTEGAGSAVFIDTTGTVRFLSRVTTQKTTTPALTLDAAADLDANTWAPAYDTDSLINSSVGSRASESGTDTTRTVTDATSIATYGPTSGDFTSYANTDLDVLNNAQYRVSGNKNPQFRLGQVAVDLYTAQTSGLYAAVGGTTIGSRIRLTNVPPGGAPVGQIDLIVQGWSDSINDSQCTVTFDTSPAESPSPTIWDDTTYGRWQCDGQTLDANITAAATTLVIDTPAGKPTFTTNAAMYPLDISIGQERITLTSAPSGSTSPQTFTGVTRGVDGTVPAAQTAGSPINLVPASAWAL